MKYDGVLDIATGARMTTAKWTNTSLRWSELVDKLITENKTPETYAEYIKFDKDKQSAIKDVGGFVGGFLVNGNRTPQAVLHRQLLTLDLDTAHADLWDDFTLQYPNAAVLHGTHKYTPENPRYRLIMPLSREVSPEEYEAIARRVAGEIGLQYFDNTTFQVNRLMFWPSTPKDIEYYVRVQDGEWLDADKVLATYDDWRNILEWPAATTFQAKLNDALNRQEDPEAKEGIIGAFCRAYSIQDAIETFIPDIYTPTANGRYSFTKGSTSGGLVIYDNKFAYSHHSTDPASGRLCNAFDLIRIHKFGHLDVNAKSTKDSSKRSFKKMEDLIVNDINVKKQIISDNTNYNLDGADWIEKLELDRSGKYVNSASNINIILRNDDFLKDAFSYNTFDRKKYINKSVPWRDIPKREPIRDVDYAGLRNYIEVVYNIVSSAKIDDAVQLEFERNAFHPIQEYLKSLSWDGIPRVDTVFIDYLGAVDSIYTREAANIMFAAAVYRVFEPGIKFDLVMTVIGPQGTGKSTFFKKLGRSWFSDTFTTFQGKEAFEQIQGVWMLEMGELSGLRKADIEAVKSFISKGEDMYRPAYGRTVEVYPRQCIFVGTTNEPDFLLDPTGNRRFIPIDSHPEKATKSIFNDLDDEIDQLWAEAYQIYLAGRPLFMSKEAEELARIEQDIHSEVDERRGLVMRYLDTKLPANWDTLDIYDRRDFLLGGLAAEGKYTRDYVCVAEIWCECLGKDKTDMTRYNTRDINAIMKSLKGWEKCNTTKVFPIYGTQKYYARKLD